MQNTDLNYSELLYLNAEKYAPEASLLQNKEELPNGKKLNVTKLGNLLAESAFAHLYFNGYIDLKLENKKFLGLIPAKKAVASQKSSGENLTSLEKRIYDLSNSLDAHMILYKVIGDECSVPWAVITQIVKDSLVSKGYLIKEEVRKKIIVEFVNYKYHLNSEKVVDLNNALSQYNEKMKEFAKTDFYKELVKEINSGIKAQVEVPDSDD